MAMSTHPDHYKTVDFRDPQYFENIFRVYYRSLTYFSVIYVKDLETAKEIVQDVFVNIWENRYKITLHTAAKPYLYRCVRNASLNYIKTKKIPVFLLEDNPQISDSDDLFENMVAAETRESIYREIEKLPKKCRKIFVMSRFDGLKHAEIANVLNLSVKSVENQIGIALKKLSKFRLLIFLSVPGAIYWVIQGVV